ncbi:DEAD/DEAH box helicase [Clostridia bacterium]|nr:DEAD/DEAH box helicase [Clostridia bacterium]
MSSFNREAEFEEALITLLLSKGWEEVLKNKSEQDLIDNWAQILFDNNQDVDRLNHQPLTKTEMQQILEKIISYRTPLKLNGFINGMSVSIKRDNPKDTIHFGKEVSLHIYDRREIAAGKSRYQIVQQPKFPTKGILNDRRGDLMLLINGMPLFHIELKKSGIPVSQATHQIEKYAQAGIFSGLFSLVQIFVAMNPEEMLYFANPGPDGKFNPDYYFHWADFDNEPINDWKNIASYFLSIPMAHQMIGFYTVPDKNDGVLKVMRSYQYYAASAISDKVAKTRWTEKDHLYGGYIWHTTGSGKTMTSFKSAQLIAGSGDADKVIFLVDRIELGMQSLSEYKNFKEEKEAVQETEDTHMLITKLRSCDSADTLIVTSIQKMSKIREDGGMNATELEDITAKRIVFIVDECHRSVFGDMLSTIKKTFPDAIFFGFTGTPIHEENERRGNTTTTVFGDELHRYSIADGIRDKNVLGFDPYMVLTYKDKELREKIAVEQANAQTVAEAVADPAKSAVYYRFMDSSKVKMAGFYDGVNNYVKGIEDYVSKEQYNRTEHRKMVVEDILEDWTRYSHGNKFHAIFATSSIPEAIAYYRLFKATDSTLKVTALFDPHSYKEGGSIDIDDPGLDIDDTDSDSNIDDPYYSASAKTEVSRETYKQAGLVEIMTDYKDRYGPKFDLATHAKFKKDIAARLAHKEAHKNIERRPDEQIDLLIVVDQMLTGFDSKWINTLYLDKMPKYENIIQAFSRTNRLFGPDKPFGTIRYYRKPHTMSRYIAEAVELYSGNRPVGMFVQKLPENLNCLNELFAEIQKVFTDASVPDFEKNPQDKASCGMFAKLWGTFNKHLEAAKIQGFYWDQSEYPSNENEEMPKISIKMDFNQTTYLILAQRYKELFSRKEGTDGVEDIPFEINGYLTEIDTGKIDSDYMNSRFEKYLRLVNLPETTQDLLAEALNDLHKTFATLTQEEQKYADIFCHEIQRGDVRPTAGKTCRDYITEYQTNAKADKIQEVADALGLPLSALYEMMNLKLTEENLDDYGRFKKLKDAVDTEKAKAFFEQRKGEQLPLKEVTIEIDNRLRKFLLEGDFDVKQGSV